MTYNVFGGTLNLYVSTLHNAGMAEAAAFKFGVQMNTTINI